MTYKPLNQYVVVKVDESPDEVAGGIILPKDKKKITEGTIVSVSDEISDKIAVGDVVIFSQYGQRVDLEDQEIALPYESLICRKY